MVLIRFEEPAVGVVALAVDAVALLVLFEGGLARQSEERRGICRNFR